MICRNCNTEVGSANYCPHCGAQVSVQYCAYCGTPLPAGARNCPHCGKPCAAPIAPAPAPVRAAGAAYDTPPSKKQLQTRRQKDEAARTGFQSFICLVCGIAGLVLLGVITYNMLMGNLFANADGIINPLDGKLSADGFALITNIEAFGNYYMKLYETVTGLFAGGNEVPMIAAALIALLPTLLFHLALMLAVIITCVATLVAVFRFIGGMCSKKFFTLVKPLAWTLSAQLFIYTACTFGGVPGWISMSSGVMLNLMLAAGGIVLCVVGNLMFAGKRFFSGGSVMKWLSNGGILAGALVALFSFPMAISSEFGEVGNESLHYVVSNVGNATFTMPDFVFYAVILVITIKLIFSLPRFVRKTATRLGTTFKFDGYEDTGFVGKSFVYLFGLLLLAVPAIVYFTLFAEAGLTVNQGLYVFIAGGAISCVCAIINRVFLNSDQQ